MTMVALLLVAAPIDAQTRKKGTRKATTTRTTTTKKKSTATAAKSTAAVKKPEAIDMGLSVKWCNMDLGAPNANTAGKVYPINTDIEAIMGEGWRIPTHKEWQELLDSTDKQIFVSQNGTPTYIELTSKVNGARIKIYYPKVAAQGAQTLNNPANGGYIIFLGNEEGDLGSIATMAANQQIKSKLKQVIKDYNLESADMSKWPDEVKNKITSVAPGLMVDSAFTYMGIAKFENDNIKEFQVPIRPVFEIDDEE